MAEGHVQDEHSRGVAAQVIQRQEQLRTQRGNWESHWEEAAELVLPRYSNHFTGDMSPKTRGEKRNQKQFDSTSALANEKFAAAMESMLTPRQQRWHRLKASDEVLNKDRDVRLWFDEVTRILFRARYSPKANFATNNFENYLSLGAFGTAGMFIDEAEDGRGIRYRALDLGGLYLATNHQGMVDTFYRRFPMTARQVMQRWGGENVPNRIKNAADKEPEREFEIIHCVRPREEVDPKRRDAQGMAFASVYVSVEGGWLLSEGGYETFPLAVGRYVTGPDEVYGRSPAMLTLPDNKVLQEQEKTLLKQGHRAVDPVLLAHDDGVMDGFSLVPGSVNYGSMTRDGKRLVDALPSGSVATGLELMDRKRQVINEAFLVTLFQILVETPQMTATEVLERAQEKGALLSPTMGRQQSEYLGPMIERELDVLARQGLLPPLPPALVEAGGEFDVEYDSPLSRAQRAEEASGFMRSLETAIAFANAKQDPSALDWFNVDTAMPDIMDINAVPTRWVASMEQVAEMRQARQQQAQEQQAIEAAPAAAGVMQAVSRSGND